MEKVSEKVEDYFKKHGKIPEIGSIFEENYINLNIFDSVGFVKMITDLETEFNIIFTSEEIENKKFQTLSGVVDIIKQKISISGKIPSN